MHSSNRAPHSVSRNSLPGEGFRMGHHIWRLDIQMHDDKPLLDEVETLDGDQWVVGNETLCLRSRQFGGRSLFLRPTRLWRSATAQMVGGSQHHTARSSVGQVGMLQSGTRRLCLPRRYGADQHRQHRSKRHRLLQGPQERPLAVFTEAEVHDSVRKITCDLSEDMCDQPAVFA